MTDDPSKKARDRKRISLEQDYEVQYWKERLGVTREELERAVHAVGHDAESVAEHLRSQKGR